MIDLHAHSTASDGSASPAQLVEAAARRGLTALALTDHDTLAGIPEFLAAGAAHPGLQLVPGVEITCHWQQRLVHILGLFISPADATLRTLLANIRYARRARNDAMLARLAELSLAISAEELTPLATPELICRSHFARILLDRGQATTIQDAFDRYIGRGRPAYVSMDLLCATQAIAAIHAAGGLAIWAHPTGLNQRSPAKVRTLCKALRDIGLDGVEAYYSHYTLEQQQHVLRIAAECRLLVSGGSDFHGDTVPGVQLGIGRGQLQIPDTVLAQLQAKLKIN